MLKSNISLEETKSFSNFFLDYIQAKDSLKEFYSHFPTPENFNEILTKRSSFPASSRSILKSTLEKQYKTVELTTSVKQNISSLADPKTFTITTGHQLNIFTGPLYFMYKIITVINACKVLKRKYPSYNFVPVYWMASEDHDFAEISYFRLYGKKYTWQSEERGAVGRFTTKGIKTILDDFPGDAGIFRDAYLNSATLSEAVRKYVHHFFGDEGLIVIDADDAALKAVAKPVMGADIIDNKVNELVASTNEKLTKAGYEPQVHCREINFFYLDNGLRSRLEKDGESFKVVDTDISFSKSEIQKLIDEHPEKLSPNVILRPLYQEMILPNLAYVGGPAEIVYWLQLKNVFDHFNIPFPALMPRNFAMVIDHPTKRKFDKTGLELPILFEPKNFIYNHWVLRNTKNDLTVGKERDSAIDMFDKLKKRAESIDKTLAPFVAAEGKRAMNSLEKIEKKMLRAEKRLHQDRLRQIDEVKNILFPNGSLQERTDNFLNFYQQDPEFISKLIGHFDPFDFSFNVLTYPAR